MLADCKTLDDYFREYGDVLGARASQALAPLHVPARDPVLPGVAAIDAHVHVARNSQLFDAQRHVLCGIVKAWGRQKSVFLNAECGTGKSLMGAAACHVAAGGRPYRALVMCPDHLLDKWRREILDTCPDVTVHRFADWEEVLKLALSHEKRPSKPRWYLIGRDQSKFEPKWVPKYATRRIYKIEMKDIRRFKARGATVADLTTTVAACPRCGTVISDKDGNLIPVDDIKTTKRLTCKGVIARWVKVGDDVKEVLSDCGEPLWTFTRQPWRWPPARIIHKKGLRFDYLITDEIHEEKSATSAQANACGKLVASSRKVLGLTGTLLGGYAEHLFPILMRLAPQSLVAAGFKWGGFKEFNEAYGKIETTIYRTSKGGGGEQNSQSMGSSTRVKTDCRPGIMPQLFGDHLLDKCVFLTLAEVSDGLPSLSEEIIPVSMDPAQANAYGAMERWFRGVLRTMLVRGDKRLLGTMLQTLLAYPDHPFGWEAIRAEDDEFTPANLDPGVVRPKEEALIAVCRRERDLGRQVWAYIQMTQTRDIGPRLVRLLGESGLRAGYLQSSVNRQKREEWIYKHGRKVDVVISHPKLVETGFDLFAKDGNHNFCTLGFYQPGYNLFTIRQAGRRAWRIGQPLPCKTLFMYYKGTMQDKAMAHIGKKMVASEALEGKFSAEGLAAMAGDDDAVMALARALIDRVDVPADRAWSRSLGFEGHAPAPPVVTPAPARSGNTLFSDEEWQMLNQLYAQMKGA